MRLTLVFNSALFHQAAAQQLNGHEGETATLYGRFFFHIKLRVAGFAPRQLNRYVSF